MTDQAPQNHTSRANYGGGLLGWFATNAYAANLLMVTLIVGGFIGTGICFWGTQLAVRTYGFGMKTGSLQFPLWLPYSIIPLGTAFFVLFCVIEICEATVALRSDRTDTATVSGGIPDIDEAGGDR